MAWETSKKQYVSEEYAYIREHEAEDKNCSIIERKTETGEWNPHKVILHKVALWNRKGEIGFGGTGLSGHVNGVSVQKINAETIDNYGYEKVGLINLDIEGAERNALSAGDTILYGIPE